MSNQISDKIIVAKISKVEKHPDANKLKICHVDDGTESCQVVCGAMNVKAGMLTILAKPGATLPSGTEIKKAQLRGVDSFGMLCSPLDLKIREERGLIDLPPNTTLGTSFEEVEAENLSSTPWYLYKHVDSHWLVDGEIQITRNDLLKTAPAGGKLVSKSYYDGENYQYRSFNEVF